MSHEGTPSTRRRPLSEGAVQSAGRLARWLPSGEGQPEERPQLADSRTPVARSFLAREVAALTTEQPLGARCRRALAARAVREGGETPGLGPAHHNRLGRHAAAGRSGVWRSAMARPGRGRSTTTVRGSQRAKPCRGAGVSASRACWRRRSTPRLQATASGASEFPTRPTVGSNAPAAETGADPKPSALTAAFRRRPRSTRKSQIRPQNASDGETYGTMALQRPSIAAGAGDRGDGDGGRIRGA